MRLPIVQGLQAPHSEAVGNKFDELCEQHDSKIYYMCASRPRLCFSSLPTTVSAPNEREKSFPSVSWRIKQMAKIAGRYRFSS